MESGIFMIGYKKWFSVFIIIFFLTCLLLLALNYVVDPFGTFGDKFLKMNSYNLSQNMRIAKVSYLETINEKFDSYIIGGSKAGALKPEIIEKYYPNSNFYNMNMVVGKLYDYEYTIYYLVNHYKVKNIILQLSQLEANKSGTAKYFKGMLHGKLFSDFPALFYLKTLFQNPSYSFDKIQEALKWNSEYVSAYFYTINNGSYNYNRQEKMIKTEPDKYYKNKANFPVKDPLIKNTVFSYNLKILKNIADFCKENDVNLLLITAPTYKTEIDSYPKEKLADYMKKIADITNYWNFSGYNSINKEKTNFYNNNHFRLKVTEMMLARIFDDNSIEIPEDFGKYITSENVEEAINIAIKSK